MSGVVRGLTAVLVLGLFLAVRPAFSLDVISDELNTDLYDCALTLVPAKKIAGDSAVTVTLETQAEGAGVRVKLLPHELLIEAGQNGKFHRYAQEKPALTPGEPYHLTIMRRADILGVLEGDALRWRGKVPRTGGKLATITPGRGWTVEDADVQRLEPVVFADNFMRTADEKGPWTVKRGNWQLRSAWDREPKGSARRFLQTAFAQNPFAWSGSSSDDTGALCTAGKPFWEDYTLSAAVFPPVAGAAGLAVNLADADNGYLLRWSPVDDRGPQGNRLCLFKLTDGKPALVEESAGGYLPGQWYRLSIHSDLDGLQVTVDGRERLAVKSVHPWRGGIGLYAEGSEGAVFDDIAVYGGTVQADLLTEHIQSQITQRFLEDHKGMTEWSQTAGDWAAMPAAPGYQFHQWDWYGDHWMTAQVTPRAPLAGELTMILAGNGQDAASGCRAVVASADTGLTCTLYHGAETLAVKTAPALEAGTEYFFRLYREGNRLRLTLDDVVLCEAADAKPPARLRPAYRLTGCFAGAAVQVLGRNALDYTFADAPTDWIGHGAWMATTRWSCSAHWSFMGGWSRGDAVLWHKRRFTGDQTFEAYLAVKMEYPRERQVYAQRYRDFGLVICGDGIDPRSGYSAVFGAVDVNGISNRAILLRNGKEVASAAITPPSMQLGGHTDWYGVKLRKCGAVVEFWYENKRLLSFTDPDPLPGGVPAIWTSDNGIAVARARLHFAEAPVLRSGPQVMLDAPWYPEWAGIGVPLTLTFTHASSTAGKPLHLQVIPRDVPPGEGPLPAIDGNTVTFTPKQAGDHWYQVEATDGEHHSPRVDLAVPVFTPSLGRDDSHALVLYHFDEGSGNTIHDHGTGPAADFVIPPDAAVNWLPGQGLSLHGINHISTARGVEKLMGIAKTHACTIEFWLSSDTIYPPTDWLGYLLSWERPGDPQHNFAVAHLAERVLVLSQGTVLDPRGNAFRSRLPGVMLFPGYRTGLQHVVITWDGTDTTVYLNNQKVGVSRTPWAVDQWIADTPLHLGHQLNPQRNITPEMAPFIGVSPEILASQWNGVHCNIGTFYLAAVHDRCFTPAEIQRHYLAGPGAR